MTLKYLDRVETLQRSFFKSGSVRFFCDHIVGNGRQTIKIVVVSLVLEEQATYFDEGRHSV